MKETIQASQIPHNYALCLNHRCSKKDNCLRQLAYQAYPDTQDECTIINPKQLSEATDGCRHYRSCTKVSYGQGMKNMLNNLPHQQTKSLAHALASHFSTSTYYRMRNGERLISPTEQTEIETLMKQCSIPTPQSYDNYVSEYDW